MRRLLRCGAWVLACALIIGDARAEAIHFGAILPLTGPHATIGTQAMRGIQFAVERANAAGGVGGNKIEVLFEDERSVNSFDKLVDRQVPVILTGSSRPALAMAPMATSKKILLVNAGAQADKLGTVSPYLVNMVPSIADEVQAISQYLAGKGKKRGVILFENSAAGIAARNDLEKYFPEAGGTILAQERVDPGQTDFRASLLKLAYAQPDVMLICAAGGVRLAQQYRNFGLNFTVAGTSLFADPDTGADGWPDGFIHTQMHIDAPDEVAAAFKGEFGAVMAFRVRQYYNAMQVLLAVTGKVLADGKPVTGENMRDTLFAVRKFQGLVPLSFEGNTATVPLEIDVVREGKDVAVKQVSSE